MIFGDFRINMHIGRVQAITDLLRKSIPERFFRQAPDSLGDHLKRLALTSPHLLADLGFELDKDLSSETREVWIRGQIAVVLNSGETVGVDVISHLPQPANGNSRIKYHSPVSFAPVKVIG